VTYCVFHSCLYRAVDRHTVPDAAHHSICHGGPWDRRDRLLDARSDSVVAHVWRTCSRPPIRHRDQANAAITMTAGTAVRTLDEPGLSAADDARIPIAWTMMAAGRCRDRPAGLANGFAGEIVHQPDAHPFLAPDRRGVLGPRRCTRTRSVSGSFSQEDTGICSRSLQNDSLAVVCIATQTSTNPACHAGDAANIRVVHEQYDSPRHRCGSHSWRPAGLRAGCVSGTVFTLSKAASIRSPRREWRARRRRKNAARAATISCGGDRANALLYAPF
jgi:hypothetical protein